MTEPTTPSSASSGAVTPHLTCRGAAEAIDYYVRAFGAVEQMRMAGPDGKRMHASVLINGAPVLLVDENLEWGLNGPQQLGGSPVTLNLGVDDADAWMARAVAAGGTERMAVSEQFWGDRYGVLEDPFGHLWALVTPVRTLSPQELQQATATAMAES